jgi:carbamoyl-phosphate synthase large subunit
MLGKRLRDLEWGTGLMPKRDLVAVKAPVFSMSKLTSVDTFLGPEMKSTGEVMGIDKSYVPAVTKALIASSHSINRGDAVLLSIADSAKPDAERLVRILGDNGHPIYATSGTARFVRTLGYEVIEVERLLSKKGTNVVTVINDGTVQAVVNVPTGGRAAEQDGFYIRRAAVERRIPCFTSIDTARCAVEAVYAPKTDGDANDSLNVMTLTEYVDV